MVRVTSPGEVPSLPVPWPLLTVTRKLLPVPATAAAAAARTQAGTDPLAEAARVRAGPGIRLVTTTE